MQDSSELSEIKADSYYQVRVENLLVTLGFVLPFVAEVFGNQSGWALHSTNPRTLLLTEADNEPSRSLTWPDRCLRIARLIISRFSRSSVMSSSLFMVGRMKSSSLWSVLLVHF
jgi:hypothetical protein